MSIKDVRPRRRDIKQDKWPGGEGSFGVLQLRQNEIQDAHFEAVKHFQNKGQPMEGPSETEFGREKELQEVYLMALQPDMEDPEQRLFKNVDEVRCQLDFNEIACVQNLHAVHMTELLIKRGLLIRLDKQKEEETKGDAS